ncbi:peptide ABC transporter ATP-binding protein [Citrobacter koseri]|uniref:Peptide ABC transporter ATP-binding protein n=1 Tax=Citrobacter koseri TaxID=545 RepID=A0A2X2WVY6_CITKO|nr:peptide ABC transporter ATP-binding protein [Citrobacter koseri]
MVETLLEVRNLSKTFRYRTGWFRRQTVEAVKPLSFTLRERQTLAIIGENGSGKSTLAKMLAGMIAPTSGELLIDDHPLKYGDYSFRSQRIRMIFQDPSTSLNPRQRISQILDFPLRLNTDLEPEQRRKQIIETMRMVGLLPDHVSYYPHMLAPGQKQRLGLARAPDFTPEGDHRRRSAGFARYVDALAAHQPDAGTPGKTGDFVYLRHSASGDDETHQRSGAGHASGRSGRTRQHC